MVRVVMGIENRLDGLVGNLADLLGNESAGLDVDTGVIHDQSVIALYYGAVADPPAGHMHGPHRILARFVGSGFLGEQLLVFQKIGRPAALDLVGVRWRLHSRLRRCRQTAACTQRSDDGDNKAGCSRSDTHGLPPVFIVKTARLAAGGAISCRYIPGMNRCTAGSASWNPCPGESPGHSCHYRSRPATRR